MHRGAFKKLFLVIGLGLSLFVAGTEATVFSFLLAFGSFMVPAGRIADIYGYKRAFLVGIALFTLMTFFSGNWAKAIQGIGAACFIPSIQAMVMHHFENHAIKMLGFFMCIFGIGVACSPILWVQISFGIFAFLLVFLFYPKEECHIKGIDMISLIFLIGFSFCLMSAIDLAGDYGFQHRHVLAWVGVAIGLLVLFVARQANLKPALIEIPFLKHHSLIMGSFFCICMLYAFMHSNLPLSYGLFFALLGGLFSHRLGIYVGMWLVALGMILLIMDMPLWSSILSGLGLGIFFPNNIFYAVQPLSKNYWGVGSAILYMSTLVAIHIALSKTAMYEIMSVELLIIAAIIVIPMIIYAAWTRST